MSSGSTQDVAVERFLRDIERRGKKLHCTVIGREGSSPHGDMNLLYRKSRLDWRHRDSDSNKKSSNTKDPSATVGKVRDLASFRLSHFRMGFLTMPASQDLSPRPCASAMAPRSQSCHSVGTNSDSGGLENGEFPGSRPPSADRRPPAKPKRHPSTRLSSPADPRSIAAPKDAPPLPPTSSQHPDKRGGDRAMNKSDSGDMLGRKVPPLKPKRSPNTQLSFDPPPLRVPHPPTPLPHHTQEGAGLGEDRDEEDEPVYIEMVGQVFSRESRAVTPHLASGPTPPAVATTPESDSDQSEAIYEEMKYPVAEEAEPRVHFPPKHEKLHHTKSAHPVATPSSSSPLPHPSSHMHSKPKAAVSISHSSPLPSSICSASTPVPQPLSSPQPPRAPTPFLLPGSKAYADAGNKIPAPFPNLLQHRPPLLAFPQPAAASSGVAAQLKAASSKAVSVSMQGPSSLTPPLGGSSASSGSKLPILQLGSKEASTPSAETRTDRKELLLGPAPGLRARSHSTPLPPSSQSSSHHYTHQHSHRPPSHYHHYRRPEKELPTSHSMKLGSQASAHTQTQTQGPTGGKESKSISFLLKSEKRDRERDTGTPSSAGTQTTPTPTPTPSTSKAGTNSAPSPAPLTSTGSTSSSTQRSSSRPLLQHPHSSHPLYHALPAYRPPPSDSPLLWTYPSAALRRPPAYDSLRGGVQPPPGAVDVSTPTGLQGKSGSLSQDGGVALGGAAMDEGPYWPMQRKMSFSHSSRDTDKEDGQAVNSDTRSRPDREDRGMFSGIPVLSSTGVVAGSGATEGTGSTGRSSEPRALTRSGLPLPCQTFPACHRNGELGRLGRSASTSGVRQGGNNMQRQCSLPPREALSQALPQAMPPTTPTLSQQQQQLQLHQQLRLQLQYQHLAQLAQCQPSTSGGGTTAPPAQGQRDGKLLEVIERKRCLCKEIKAHRRPDRNLCKQDSMPILPSWKRTPEPRKTGTPPCQPPAVLWDTSI